VIANGVGATEGTLAGIAAEAEAIALLRRIAHLLESSGAVDAGGRQRILIDAITGSLTLTTVTTVGTVSAITAVANMGPEQWINIARNAYANGIRANLAWG